MKIYNLKETAEQCNITVQALRKWCKRNDIPKDAKGKYLITEEVKMEIEKHYGVETKNSENTETMETKNSENTETMETMETKNSETMETMETKNTVNKLIDMLEKQLEIKDQQLEVKDKQIQELNDRLKEASERIKEMNILLDQQQHLHFLETKEKIPKESQNKVETEELEKKKWWMFWK